MYTTMIKPRVEAEVTEGLDREAAEQIVARAFADHRGHKEIQPGDEEDARNLVQGPCQYDDRLGTVSWSLTRMYTTIIKPRVEAEVTEGLDREAAEQIVARGLADQRRHKEIQPGDEEDARDLVQGCRYGSLGTVYDEVRVLYTK